MTLKILKCLTVVSFLFITFSFSGGHIGGQFGAFIILFLFLGGLNSVFSLLTLITLTLFVISAFKPFKARDFYVFIIGGIVLMIPIIMQIDTLVSKIKNRSTIVFYLTAGAFLIFYGITLFRIKKSE